MKIKNDIDKYMRWEDRSDPKWAWPGATTTIWSADGMEEGNELMLDPDATEEEVAEQRMINDLGLEAMGGSLVYDTDVNGEFIDTMAKGCPEEPDAPEILIHIRLPKGWQDEPEPLPIVFYCFGAGFQYSAPLFDREIIDLSDELHCAVVSYNYRLHPENKFPTAINDTHAAYLWTLEHAAEYNMDPNRIVTTGQSWGGYLSIAICHRLKRCGDPQPRGVVACSPVIDDRGVGTSATYCSTPGRDLTERATQRVMHSYLGWPNVGLGALLPEACPNHATVDDVRGLAPMAFHIMESDPCRDPQLQYAQKLLDAGTFCAYRVWGGTNHGSFVGLSCSHTTDPYQQRWRRELLADFQGFFDYDFARPWTVK